MKEQHVLATGCLARSSPCPEQLAPRGDPRGTQCLPLAQASCRKCFMLLQSAGDIDSEQCGFQQPALLPFFCPFSGGWREQLSLLHPPMPRDGEKNQTSPVVHLCPITQNSSGTLQEELK